VTPQTVILEASRRYAFTRQLQSRKLVQNDKVLTKFLVQEPVGTATDGEPRIARLQGDFVEGSRLPYAPGRPNSNHFRRGTDRAYRDWAAAPLSERLNAARRSKIHGA
jgi:hypothetical protein